MEVAKGKAHMFCSALWSIGVCPCIYYGESADAVTGGISAGASRESGDSDAPLALSGFGAGQHAAEEPDSCHFPPCRGPRKHAGGS